MRELTGHFDGCGLTELCRVEVIDEPHPKNGAHHHYRLMRDQTPEELAISRSYFSGNPESVLVGEIMFQRGPRNEPDSTPGTLDGAVLSVLIDRFECFQAGPFACPGNVTVLGLLTEARKYIIERAKERAARGVLGKNEK